MFYAEDEDVTNKVPAVSPNDVIDIEVSPLIRARASSWLRGFDKTSKKSKVQPTISATKEKKGRKLKNNHTTPKKQKETMKRGDPFLPSVMCDENPVADFSSKKGVHKKPMDCKCKGMGFNCSPSAVLPDEMIQQWGYGMFGKNSSAGASCTDNSEAAMATRPSVSNGHPLENLSTKTFSSKCRYGTATGHGNSPRFKSNTCMPVRFCECKKESCCCPTAKVKQEPFPYSEATEKKRQKLTNKNTGYKIKGSKTQILISAKNNLQTMKTIACINNKENTNIISTSNFNKNNHSSSSFSSFRHELENGRPHLKGNINLSNSGGNSTGQGSSIECAYMRNKMFPSPPHNTMLPEESEVTTCSRYRHRMKGTRRSFLNIRQPPSLATRDNAMNGSVRFYEPRKCLPRITTQNYIPGSQLCSCDRCRRKALLLSKMEALGFPSSSAQINPSPYSYPVSHRYYAPSMQSSIHPSNPYTSCAPLSHTYTSSPGIYCPPTSYDRSSPNFDSEPYVNKTDIFSTSSMPLISRGVNTEAASYLDTEASLESPLSYSGIIEDITDLSIKDTVEFFMTLRSPLADSQKSTLSDDASSEMIPGVSSEDEAFNCCIGSCACSKKQHSFVHLNSSEMMNLDKLPSTPPRPLKIHNYTDSCPTDAPTQSMSLLYSSLMSNLGLEDELRCAIENIPME